MTCSYHSGLAASREAIRLARDELLRVIESLGRSEFESARKGGWPVRKVLEHLIYSERLYAQATAYLCGTEVSGRDDCGRYWRRRRKPILRNSREPWLAFQFPNHFFIPLDEIFYELKRVAHEEYSVLSVLENVASHDREHAAQIRAIVEDKTAGELTAKPQDLIN